MGKKEGRISKYYLHGHEDLCLAASGHRWVYESHLKHKSDSYYYSPFHRVSVFDQFWQPTHCKSKITCYAFGLKECLFLSAVHGSLKKKKKRYNFSSQTLPFPEMITRELAWKQFCQWLYKDQTFCWPHLYFPHLHLVPSPVQNVAETLGNRVL